MYGYRILMQFLFSIDILADENFDLRVWKLCGILQWFIWWEADWVNSDNDDDDDEAFDVV